MAALTGSFYALNNVREIDNEWQAGCLPLETLEPQSDSSAPPEDYWNAAEDYYSDPLAPDHYQLQPAMMTGQWIRPMKPQQPQHCQPCNCKQLSDWHHFEVLLTGGNIVASAASLVGLTLSSLRLAGFGPTVAINANVRRSFPPKRNSDAAKQNVPLGEVPEDEEQVEEVKLENFI